MGLQFGIFDHIEPVPGQALTQIYRERLHLLERYDAAGFYAYHLAEHHTPAVHSLAPSQNVFLAAASQRTAFCEGLTEVYLAGTNLQIQPGDALAVVASESRTRAKR